MASVVHGRHTTGLPWLRAAMIQHRMARRFALIVTKIHILSAASNLMKKLCGWQHVIRTAFHRWALWFLTQIF